KVQLPETVNPPEELLDLFIREDSIGRSFRSMIRGYNNALAFASIKCTPDNSVTFSQGGGVYTFRVSGDIQHRIGSLIPSNSAHPNFSQVYFVDGAKDAVPTSFMEPIMFSGLSKAILTQLRRVLYEHNPYAQRFRQIGMEYLQTQTASANGTLVEERGYDKRRYNVPTADEVAAIIPGDEFALERSRSLVVYLQQPEENAYDVFQTIKDTSCLYAPLHYVLLFP
ncbi:hypothetical protein BJ508DRAFT_194650, partial [Ascobolus immersus RN42]